MESDNIKTVDDMCDYILEYADCIYVREEIAGKWGSFSLTELPVQKALAHAFRFITEGRIPIRLVKDVK